MSKKLLSESQVRRFMGLAGMQASTVSNRINEMYGDKEEEMHKEGMHDDKEETYMKEEEEDADPVEDEAAMSPEPEMDMGDE